MQMSRDAVSSSANEDTALPYTLKIEDYDNDEGSKGEDSASAFTYNYLHDVFYKMVSVTEFEEKKDVSAFRAKVGSATYSFSPTRKDWINFTWESSENETHENAYCYAQQFIDHSKLMEYTSKMAKYSLKRKIQEHKIASKNLSASLVGAHSYQVAQAKKVLDEDIEDLKSQKKSDGAAGWKIHISINEESKNLEKAFNIVLYHMVENQMPEGKIKTKTPYEGSSKEQAGKVFCIYFGSSVLIHNPMVSEKIGLFLFSILNDFQKNGVINGDPVKNENKLIPDSDFFYYRNDSDREGNYIDAHGSDSFNPSGDFDALQNIILMYFYLQTIGKQSLCSIEDSKEFTFFRLEESDSEQSHSDSSESEESATESVSSSNS